MTVEAPVVHRKKLIEVALPLDAINAASAREKSIRHGHPSTLHLWWARRPLAAARAVIFAQMVDDPSTYVDELLADPVTRSAAEVELRSRLETWEKQRQEYEEAQQRGESVSEPGPKPTLEECAADLERQRLFTLIEELVKWENTTNEEVLQRAREEIWKSWRRTCRDNAGHPRAAELFNPDKLPAFHDPFAGGGSLPLEAQRLGLEAYASDLNPVAVLINKAMIEIPPKFAGQPPVNPEARKDRSLFERDWKGAEGLAEDIRYYGKWMRDEAEKRIGHLYPKVKITPELIHERPDLKRYEGKELTVIAWIWARTVKSPNPAFAHVHVPLATTFMLSTKKGKEAYVEPIIDGGGYRFTVKSGEPKDIEAAKNGTKLGRGANFRCLMSEMPIPGDYIKAEGRVGRMAARMMAIVAEGERERVYLSPTIEMEEVARSAQPVWKPDTPLPPDPRAFWTNAYGLTTFGDLFTNRQLVALATFSDLVQEARERVKEDAINSGLPDDQRALEGGGKGASAYADAVGVYLGLAVGRSANYWSSLTPWGGDFIVQTFARQTLPVVWDYAEGNPLSNSTGNWTGALEWIEKVIRNALPVSHFGKAVQNAAQSQAISRSKIISTDPPYYDNIVYSDLSDFFYIWLKRALRPIAPALFATLSVPKAEELVASPYRHGGKERAEAFFLHEMTKALQRLAQQAHPSFPITIYYAFKQSETRGGQGTASTGWETFLDAVIRAGLAVGGTWPMRTERDQGLKTGTNVLASSIVLVCRRRPKDARIAPRREFVSRLKAELPEALRLLQRGNIAPVDLAQAAIGPGMAIYTRYSRVIDASGNPLSVRDALALINEVLDEILAEQEGDFDADTRWAIAWFDQHGFEEGAFGQADVLARAKNTSVTGMVEAGILISRAGKVRLLAPEELSEGWDPEKDPRLSVWEMVHHLIRVLGTEGERGAARIVAKLGSEADVARELAYRLYTISERKKRAQEALLYNSLVQSWAEIARLAREMRGSDATPIQGTLLQEVRDPHGHHQS